MPPASAALLASGPAVQPTITLPLALPRAQHVNPTHGQQLAPAHACPILDTMMQLVWGMEYGADTHTTRSTVPPKCGQMSLQTGGTELPLMLGQAHMASQHPVQLVMELQHQSAQCKEVL